MKTSLKKHNIYVSIFICFLVILVDRVSKNFVLGLEEGTSIPIIKNMIHITFIYNRGAGFGTFQNASIFLAIFAFLILICAIYYFFKSKGMTLRIILAILVAGIVGNFTDRIIYGKVVDFIDLRIWPVFNVADVAITLGILSLIVYIWIKDKGDLKSSS